MVSPQLPPEDRDLAAMPNDRLLKEVARMTTRIKAATPARRRRDRAMRILRARKVPRVRIAKVADISEGAVTNLIDKLNDAEAREAAAE